MTKQLHALRRSLPLLIAAAFLVVSVQPASAVPVFARKYKTSCQTCHTVFPKLNPFGEAFRLNGYRLPAETEDQIKQTPVSLGAEAYARVWPEAVFPSDLPGNAPVAINVKMADLYQSSHEDGEREIIHNDFQFPQEVNMFTAGTLGDKLSFFGELTYEIEDGETSVGIEHAQLNVDSPFGPENLVHFRFGKFAPDYADGFQEMWLMTNNGIDTMFAYNPIGIHGGTGLSEDMGGISLPMMATGIEMYGVASHRLFYTVGVINGMMGMGDTFDGNSGKDVYARVDYKFGGMGLDGDTEGVELPPQNWREKSLRVGILGYTGDGKNVDFMVEDDDGMGYDMQDRRYQRVGAYLSGIVGDLNVFGAYVHGTDHLRLMDMETGDKISDTKPDYDAWFVQADYVIDPPFQVSVRYENLRPGDKSVESMKVLNANFTWLARANVKAMLEYNRDLRDAKSYQLAAVLRFAY